MRCTSRHRPVPKGWKGLESRRREFCRSWLYPREPRITDVKIHPTNAPCSERRLLSKMSGSAAFPMNGTACSDHYITHKPRRHRSIVAIGMGLVAGEHEELPRRDLLRCVAQHQRQAAFEHKNLLTPAFGIRLGRINLARLQ